MWLIWGVLDAGVDRQLAPICLVGRLCTGKSFNAFALIDVLKKGFRPKGKLTARDWGKGTWIFSFEREDDRKWVIHNQPWHFDTHLFAIRPLTGFEQPSAVSIDTTYFWVRAYDLPIHFHTEHVLKTLAGRVGRLISFEKPGTLVSPFLRFRVDMDITRPLLRGIKIRIGGSMFWISLRYESLPPYCYCCGVIGHFSNSCALLDRDAVVRTEDMAFPPVLKADPLRCPRGEAVELVVIPQSPNEGGSLHGTMSVNAEIGSIVDPPLVPQSAAMGCQVTHIVPSVTHTHSPFFPANVLSHAHIPLAPCSLIPSSGTVTSSPAIHTSVSAQVPVSTSSGIHTSDTLPAIQGVPSTIPVDHIFQNLLSQLSHFNVTVSV
ncbi:hypothetical protein ACS0TY_032350 [Phlomoides rotata]